MINATNLRNGATFLYNGKPYKVIKYTHQKIGRGGATVKVKVRNLISGSVEEHSFSAEVTFEEADINKRKLQFLYFDEKNAVFMDPKTYEQEEIPLSVLEKQKMFLKEGQEMDILFWEDRPLLVDIPPKITLEVKETDPGVKGNSATNIYKPAVLENDYKLKVPLFIKVGDKIRLDTRTGEYVERVR